MLALRRRLAGDALKVGKLLFLRGAFLCAQSRRRKALNTTGFGLHRRANVLRRVVHLLDACVGDARALWFLCLRKQASRGKVFYWLVPKISQIWEC